MKKLYLRWLWLFGLLIIPTFAFGHGFHVYEQGGKAVGMGGAFSAQADDPSAIYFNPAGITQLEGTQVSAGISPIIPKATFRSNGNVIMGSSPGETTDTKDNVWFIPSAYITQKVTDKFSIGLGSFSHFGLGQEWPDDFEGRFSAGSIKSVLTTNSICPVVAFKPLDWLSLAFGPYFQYLDIEIINRAFIAAPVPPLTSNRNLDRTVEAKLKGSDWDLGWNAGVLIQLPKNFTFGAAYLSEVRHRITDGKQELTRLSNGVTIKKVDGSASITIPATLKLGLAWKPHPWTFEIDAYWTEWSTYRNLRADFSDGTFLDVPKKWKNSWTWRFGAQYALSKYFDLRAGFIYDQSPIPDNTLDPLVPSGNRKLYCVGLGSHFGKLTIDLGYNYLQDQDLRWDNSAGDVKVGATKITRVTGKFEDGYAHILAISISYRF